jgi:integrase
MTLDEVHAVIVAASLIDPAAELALRLAAVAGARRPELAALQWTDAHDRMLTVDSAVEVVRRGDRRPVVRDAATGQQLVARA